MHSVTVGRTDGQTKDSVMPIVGFAHQLIVPLHNTGAFQDRVGQKISLLIFAITLSIASQFSYFLADVHYRKFATGRYVVSPPNMVCVTTLPCKISTTSFFTLNFIHCCKKSSFYFVSNNNIANFCRMIFKRIVYTWRILLIFKSRVRPGGRVIIAMAADDVINYILGFKEFVTTMGNVSCNTVDNINFQ